MAGKLPRLFGQKRRAAAPTDVDAKAARPTQGLAAQDADTSKAADVDAAFSMQSDAAQAAPAEKADAAQALACGQDLPAGEADAAQAVPAGEKTPAKKSKHRRAFWRRRQKELPALPPMPDLVVAPFDKRDYRALSVLVGAQRTANGLPGLTQRQWAALRLAIEDERLTYYIAWYRGAAVGLCAVCGGFAADDCVPAGMLQQFYLAPDASPADAGPALADQAAAWARAQGCGALYAACPAPHRPLYQALGFVLTAQGLLRLPL